MYHTVFDDGSNRSLIKGTLPYIGSYKSFDILSKLNGEPIKGRWTLLIDTSSKFNDSLNIDWSLFVESDDSPPKDSPDSGKVYIGNQFVKEENFQQARISFKEALAANPQSSAALSSLLYVNEISPLEREDLFIVDYLAAQHINLTTDLYLPLARLYLRQNKFKEASNLMEGLKLHKVKAKDWEEINAINKVIENKKTKFALDAHKVLEAFYASELKYSQALEHVEEILKLEPGTPEYLKKRDDYQVEEIK